MRNAVILSTVLASALTGCNSGSRGEIQEMSCTRDISDIAPLTRQQLELTIKDEIAKICGNVSTFGYGDRLSEVRAPVTVIIGQSGQVHFIQSNMENLLKDPVGFSKK